MVSRVVSLSPVSGSMLTAWSLLGILCLPLSLCPTPTLSQNNKLTKKKRKKTAKEKYTPVSPLLPILQLTSDIWSPKVGSGVLHPSGAPHNLTPFRHYLPGDSLRPPQVNTRPHKTVPARLQTPTTSPCCLLLVLLTNGL